MGNDAKTAPILCTFLTNKPKKRPPMLRHTLRFRAVSSGANNKNYPSPDVTGHFLRKHPVSSGANKKNLSPSRCYEAFSAKTPRFIWGGSDTKQGSICKCIDKKQKRGVYE